MHELGLVNYVVKTVTRIAEENGAKRVSSVTLEFGEVSGVVPEYLYSYWNWYTKKFPLFDGARLVCETIPALTWCDACRRTYRTVEHGKICPYCGSGETWLRQGSEMNIKQIEVEEG